MTLIILTLIAVLTSVISGLVGMAGGIVLLSLMTFFVPWNVLIPVHGIVQLISNGSRCLMLRKKINYKVFIPFILGLPFGVIVATLIVGQLSSADIPLLFVVILILYTLFKPKKMPPLKIPMWAFSILGLVTGFFTLLVGATGPLIAPFFLRDDLAKEEIVATKAACQAIGHLFKLPAFFYLGFNYGEYLTMIISMSVAAIVGTKLGVLLLGRINEQYFRVIYKLALGAAALRLLYKIFIV